jgi:D-alanyl-D-alanine carboxypeptidase/D-alanyl-D-alanine-endopeptidase (penicillin-binding protein 4)
VAPTATPEVGSVTLALEIDRLLSDPSFSQAFWSIKVQELTGGKTLYERNPDRLVMPASNVKLITTATALRVLGPDYRPVTRLYAAGEVADGVLNGDLVLVGGGDPSLGGRWEAEDPLRSREDPWRAMRSLAAMVVEAGIDRITGRIIGVDDFFAEEPFSPGWSWDGLSQGYSAAVSALTWNEGVVELAVTGAAQPGSQASVRLKPDVGALLLDARVSTVGALSRASVRVTRELGSDTLVVRGTVPAGGRDSIRDVSVPDPARFALLGLRQALTEAGIAVEGSILDQDDLPPVERSVTFEAGHGMMVQEGLTPVGELEGPPMSWLVMLTNKISQNTYAETLLRLVAAEREGVGSVARGRAIAEQQLLSMGIPASQYVLRDGSGLSRYNYLTAEVLSRLLRAMVRHRTATEWYESLPIMGVDGTLRGRGVGSPVAGRVRAKTGYIANSRALSGYVVAASGDTLTVSMIANNFTDPTRAVEYLQDLICELLATGGGG